MPQKFVGDPHLTKKLQPGYPRLNRDVTGGWRIEYLYHVNKTILNEVIPSPGVYLPEYEEVFGLPPMIVAEVNVEQHNAEDIRIVRIVYAEPDRVERSPESEYSESDVQVSEKPITEHPDWRNVGTDELDRAAKQTLLQEHYKTFQHTRVSYTFTRTFQRNNYRITEASMTEGLNNLSSPEGISDASAGNWLKVGRRIVRDNASVEVTDNWVYDQDGWEGTIRYDTTLNEIIANLPGG